MGKQGMCVRSDVVLDLSARRNNPRNSEGAFVTLKDGRILFAYSRYRGKDWMDHATADIAARTSADGGRSWTASDRILVRNEGGCNVMSVSLLRLQDGRIALFYLVKNSLHDCRLYMRASANEGRTWSERVSCIPAPGYFVVNNDRVIQLRSGRLVAPAGLHRVKSAAPGFDYGALDLRGIVMFFLSDDGGATWRESRDWWALPVQNLQGLQEPGVVELADGSLYAWARTGTGRQWQMRSEDGGETWTPPEPSNFLSPCSPLSMKRMPSSGDLLAVWNDLSPHWGVPKKKLENGWGVGDPSWGRTPLAAAISCDDGKTWRPAKLIENDPSRGFCYTAIHFTDDAVLLGYCCGGGRKSVVLQDLCVRRIALKELCRAR